VGDKAIKLEPLPEEFSDMAEVVYKSLDHNPMNRFQTAAEMQVALEETLVPAWSY
jgi:hypothetical protein